MAKSQNDTAEWGALTSDLVLSPAEIDAKAQGLLDQMTLQEK